MRRTWCRRSRRSQQQHPAERKERPGIPSDARPFRALGQHDNLRNQDADAREIHAVRDVRGYALASVMEHGADLVLTCRLLSDGVILTARVRASASLISI